MPWDPEQYNRFKSVRYKPFFDLMGMIAPDGLQYCVDIGCGTGEQTAILAERLAPESFLGIDPSPEMLAESGAFVRQGLAFKHGTVESFIASGPEASYDLIFSNAALQWSDSHESLFPKLISLLGERGQLAVQMPMQPENVLNGLLLELVQERPFADFLDGWKRESPVLGMDAYARILFENGMDDLQLIKKVYPIIAKDADELIDFIAGSALIPYTERMSATQKGLFVAEYRNRVQLAFKRFPAIYAFKRLLLYGRRGATPTP